MEDSKVQSIKRSEQNYRVERPRQTGFSSPATHYNEPRIDLNAALVEHPSATFFIRASDDAFQDHGILKNDVLIIDKSLAAKNDQLVVAIGDDAFRVVRIGERQDAEITIWGVITYIVKSVI